MKELNNNPPQFFLRFFRWFCHPSLKRYIEGDLMELYDEKLRVSGKRKADLKFIIDVLLLFRPGIIRPMEGVTTINTYGMYKSYFKIAWRNLLKNKGYSSINIVGLATGMTVAMLIGLWIWDELSFDSYFQNRDRLAQVGLNQTDHGITYTGGTVQMPLGDALRTKYATDIKALSLTSWNNDHGLTVGDKKLSAKGMWVQPDFPQMFTLHMVSGTRDALKDPSAILISSTLAKSIFGNSDPVNKTIRIDNRMDLTVGGVYADLPHNTTFHETRLLLPWGNQQNWMNSETSWMNHCGQLFVQLYDHADFNQTIQKIKNVPTPYIKQWKEEVMLLPLSKAHLYNEFKNGKNSGGRITFVWLFGIIGVFVLLLACINFMNLSTARSEKRAKEVGIRKTIGSQRTQLVGQFLTESVVITLLAFVLSLLATQLALPFFNDLADKNISIAWNNPVFWILALGFTLFTGIVSGSYPAFYLSSFKPGSVLKGARKVGRLASLPRKVLVVIQFTVSLTLIIGTAVVFQQIRFAKNRITGYNREGLITVNINTPELEKHYDALKNDLMQTGALTNVARSSQSPAHFGNNNGVDWRGKDPDLVVFFRNVNVTPEFGQTIDWTIKEGRDFSEEISSDSAATLVNETAVRTMGFKNPLGEIVKFGGNDYTIIGVVKDMVTDSPYKPVEPAIFFNRGWLGIITLHLNPEISIKEALAKIETVFRKHDPNAPFEFSFVDEVFDRKFSNEERIGNLAALFAILAIFISCLGLFGLASFVAEQRTKEIGIRKVLGASVSNLWRMMSRDFLALVIISCAISTPLSIVFMNDWLVQYDYRTNLSWELFAGATAGVMLLTLLTVSYQAVKAAMANPINSLRSE